MTAFGDALQATSRALMNRSDADPTHSNRGHAAAQALRAFAERPDMAGPAQATMRSQVNALADRLAGMNNGQVEAMLARPSRAGAGAPTMGALMTGYLDDPAVFSAPGNGLFTALNRASAPLARPLTENERLFNSAMGRLAGNAAFREAMRTGNGIAAANIIHNDPLLHNMAVRNQPVEQAINLLERTLRASDTATPAGFHHPGRAILNMNNVPATATTQLQNWASNVGLTRDLATPVATRPPVPPTVRPPAPEPTMYLVRSGSSLFMAPQVPQTQPGAVFTDASTSGPNVYLAQRSQWIPVPARDAEQLRRTFRDSGMAPLELHTGGGHTTAMRPVGIGGGGFTPTRPLNHSEVSLVTAATHVTTGTSHGTGGTSHGASGTETGFTYTPGARSGWSLPTWLGGSAPPGRITLPTLPPDTNSSSIGRTIRVTVEPDTAPNQFKLTATWVSGHGSDARIRSETINNLTREQLAGLQWGGGAGAREISFQTRGNVGAANLGNISGLASASFNPHSFHSSLFPHNGAGSTVTFSGMSRQQTAAFTHAQNEAPATHAATDRREAAAAARRAEQQAHATMRADYSRRQTTVLANVGSEIRHNGPNKAAAIQFLTDYRATYQCNRAAQICMGNARMCASYGNPLGAQQCMMMAYQYNNAARQYGARAQQEAVQFGGIAPGGSTVAYNHVPGGGGHSAGVHV